jgi:hypothetical protein
MAAKSESSCDADLTAWEVDHNHSAAVSNSSRNGRKGRKANPFFSPSQRLTKPAGIDPMLSRLTGDHTFASRALLVRILPHDSQSGLELTTASRGKDHRSEREQRE